MNRRHSLPGWPVRLVPVNELQLLGEAEGIASWQMTGLDPQFELVIDGHGRIPPGHYRLWLELSDASDLADQLTAPRLYFDHGGGYHESESLAVGFRRHGRGYEALVPLQAAAVRCRFDPSVRPGRLDLGAVSLQRLSRAGFYGTAIGRLVRSRVRGPRSGLRSLVRAAAIVRAGGFGALAAALRQANQATTAGATNYRAWIAAHDAVTPADRERMHALAARFPTPPRISVVMPTFDTPPEMLRQAIESVLDQTYDAWELCIADDRSTAAGVREILREYAARDSRIKVAYRAENGRIAAASNTAIGLATGDWIAFLDHDDRLAPQALFCVADAIVRNPQAQLLYSDEDKLDGRGTRCDPYFKPDWNLELVRSHNLVTHLAVYRTSRLRELGCLREGFDGAQDYDLVLRYTEALATDEIVHLPHVLYHWRVHEASTAAAGGAKPQAMRAGERALDEHLERSGVRGRARLIGFGYRVDYALPEVPPLVSIIIPTRNAEQLVGRCIDSIRQRSTYRPYEIILVDNGSDDPAALAAFAALAAAADVRVIRDCRPFNYSALNNAAARIAAGAVFVLLNNDTEVITPDWLERLVSIALQPDVGAVGAKLLFPDDRVQHAGVILGLGGLAAHAHEGLERTSPGAVGRAALQLDVSAVTGACLAVRREHFLRVGGLDERDLAVAYNDVDFCLKLRALGLRNVWTPFAELYHHESATRGYETTPEKQRRFEAEKDVIRSRWRKWLDHDPAYNPNLTDSRADFSLAWPPRVQHPWLR